MIAGDQRSASGNLKSKTMDAAPSSVRRFASLQQIAWPRPLSGRGQRRLIDIDDAHGHIGCWDGGTIAHRRRNRCRSGSHRVRVAEPEPGQQQHRCQPQQHRQRATSPHSPVPWRRGAAMQRVLQRLGVNSMHWTCGVGGEFSASDEGSIPTRCGCSAPFLRDGDAWQQPRPWRSPPGWHRKRPDAPRSYRQNVCPRVSCPRDDREETLAQRLAHRPNR